MTTYEEYVAKNFSKASPEILNLLSKKGHLSTTEFIEKYKGLITAYKADCKRMYPYRYAYKEERNEFARYVASAFGWYDWFCEATALIGRTANYGSKIAHIIKEIPELADGTEVGFSQRYGNGYVDCFGIAPTAESVKKGAPYGYTIRVNTKADRDEGAPMYYVYRDDRVWGADIECNSLREVIMFIRKDLRLWKSGFTTKEYDRETEIATEYDVRSDVAFDEMVPLRTVVA